MQPTATQHGCAASIIGVDRDEQCGASLWRGWVFGSSAINATTPGQFEHLVIAIAPRRLTNPARAVDGPVTPPGARLTPMGAVTVDGTLMRWYFVPAQANEGSAFMHHLVLVWNAGGHTYAYGFHVVTTVRDARALDLEVVEHLVEVRPDDEPGRD